MGWGTAGTVVESSCTDPTGGLLADASRHHQSSSRVPTSTISAGFIHDATI